MASAPPTERPCPVTTVDRARPFPLRYGELTLRATPRARDRRTSSTRRRRTPPPPRPASARAGRSSRSSSPTRPTSALAAGASSTGPSRSSSTAGGTPADRAEAGADAGAPRARGPSSSRAATSPRSRAAGGSIRSRLHVVPNPAPPARAATAAERSGLVFAGRLTRQKAMHVALDALAHVPAAQLTSSATAPTAPASSGMPTRPG